MPLYRDMTRAELDAAYNNREAVPGYAAIVAERKARGEEARSARAFHANLRYGERPREVLDFFPAAAPGAPVVAFIHGGYWQSSEKEASTFLVEGPLSHGISVALIEYSLAPQIDIDAIVGQIDRALDWLAHHAASLGADPGKLFAAGHSAGGHLTAMMLGKRPLAGAMAISGLFDLEPIRLSYLNDKLGLTEASARRNSPQLHLPAACPPVIVAVGGDELPELVRQSGEYAAALEARGLPVEEMVLPGHHHFSILEDLAQPDGKLCRQLARLVALSVPA